MGASPEPVGLTSGAGEVPAVPALAVATQRLRPDERPIKIIRPPAFSLLTFFSALVTLRHYSDLLYTLSSFRLTVRYKQSLLGWAWAVLQPLALMAIYTVIFTRITKVSTGGMPYPLFVLSGLLPWIFFSGSLSNAVNGLTAYPNLLTKMYFPREILPFSYLAAGFADFCISLIILGFLVVYYHVALTWNVLYAVPIMLLLMVFAAAMALLFSSVQVRFRDVGLALPLLLQVWIFTTPVVYALSSVPVRFRTLYLLDPLAGLIESFRLVVVGGSQPDIAVLTYSGVISIACFVLGYICFKSSEATMADVI